MSDTKITLNRRRVLGGLITIGGAAAAAGAGTTALFFDEQTTTNDIQAGTLSLESTSSSFSIGGLMPGEQTAQQSVTADYSGDVDAEFDFDIALSGLSSDAGNKTGTEFAQQLQLDVAELSIGGDVVQNFASNNATLAEIAGNYETIATVTDGDSIAFDLQATLDSTTNNSFQGEGVAIDVTFTAEQSNRD